MSRHSIELPMSSERPTVEVVASAIDLEPSVCSQESPSLEAKGSREGIGNVEVRLEGDVTRITLPSEWAGFELPSRLTLKVPPHVRARITNDAARLHVQGLAGCDLELTCHAGSLTLDDVRGRLNLQADSGSIKGTHVAGTFAVRSVAGAVKLGIDALDAGQHLIRTAMGTVKVELAPGQRVRIDTSTTLGSSRNTYPSTADAPAVLRLEADLGAVKVSEGSPVADPRHGDWPDWRRLWNDVARDLTQAVSTFTRAPIDDAPPKPKEAAPPSQEVRKVLELLQNGAISVDDAERLIRAIR